MLWLLDGDTPVRDLVKMVKKLSTVALTGGALPRLGIPGVRFSDGPRGVVIGNSTAFPVTIARAATWEPDLEERVGQAMGVEARAAGANYSGAVCVNLLRHPAWGRAQECYGEDPVLTGRMGAGLTRGLRRNVMACVKHFALNSIENSRFKVDVTVDEHALHEVYLPHFKTVVDAGVDSVMSSYNSVNGHFADVNKVLLTDILRDEWGFDGFVTSDWVFGIHDAVRSLEAGMDVEMPLRLVRARELPAALESGRLSRETVLTSARRILATTLRHYAIRNEGDPPASVVAKAEHRILARHVAARGAVLLKNDPSAVSPCCRWRTEIKRLAVIGALATEANLGDHGSSRVRPPATSSPLDGLREALPRTEIVYVDGSDAAAAARAAADADVAIVVAGMTWKDEGEFIANDNTESLKILGFPFNSRVLQFVEGKVAALGKRFAKGGDRQSLTLHRPDEELIAAVAEANARTVVGRDRWERDHHGGLASSCPGDSDGLVSGDGRWAGDRRCPHRRSGAGWTAAGRHSHRCRAIYPSSTHERRRSPTTPGGVNANSTATATPRRIRSASGSDTRHSTWSSSTIGRPTVRPSPLSVSAIPGSAPAPPSPRSMRSATPRTRCLSWSVSAASSCPPGVRTPSRSTST